MALDVPKTAQATLESYARELYGVTDNETPRPPPKTRDRPGGKPRSPILSFVENLPGEYLITNQVAEILGISPHTVRRLSKARITHAPSYMARFGKNQIALYTREDVQVLAEYLTESREVLTREAYDSVQAKYKSKYFEPREIG